MSIIAELTELGKEIEKAKREVAQLEGRRAEIMDRLKKEFDCLTIEEADNLLEQLDYSMKILEVEIQKDFDKLKETFTW